MKNLFQKDMGIVPYIMILLIIVAIAAVIFLKNGRSEFTEKVDVNITEKYNLLSNVMDLNDMSYYEFYSNDDSVAIVDKNTGIVEAKKSGEVTIEVRSKEDNKVVKNIIVSVKGNVDSKVTFDKTNYSCKVGEKVDVLVTASGGAGARVISTVSNNTGIALLNDNYSDGSQVKCVNCRAYHIECKKEGTTTLTAKDNSNNTATAKVTVEASTSTSGIKFDKTNYSCKVGEKVDVLVTASGGAGARVISTVSNNTGIALLNDNYSDGSQVKCVNCRAYHIECKKEGTITLTAKDNSNNTATATVSINN